MSLGPNSVVIEPAHGLAALQLGAVWQYRELLATGAIFFRNTERTFADII